MAPLAETISNEATPTRYEVAAYRLPSFVDATPFYRFLYLAPSSVLHFFCGPADTQGSVLKGEASPAFNLDQARRETRRLITEYRTTFPNHRWIIRPQRI